MTKTNKTGKINHSLEWSLSKELAKRNKRLQIITVVIIVLWLVTALGWCVTLKNNSLLTDALSEESLFFESDGQNMYETKVS